MGHVGKAALGYRLLGGKDLLRVNGSWRQDSVGPPVVVRDASVVCQWVNGSMGHGGKTALGYRLLWGIGGKAALGYRLLGGKDLLWGSGQLINGSMSHGGKAAFG